MKNKFINIFIACGVGGLICDFLYLLGTLGDVDEPIHKFCNSVWFNTPPTRWDFFCLLIIFTSTFLTLFLLDNKKA